MLRLRFAPLSMTGDDAPVVMLSEAKHLIPLYCRVLRCERHILGSGNFFSKKLEIKVVQRPIFYCYGRL